MRILFFMFALALSACGKNTVTVRLIPGTLPIKNSPNLAHDFFAVPMIPGTQVGWCDQKSIFVGYQISDNTPVGTNLPVKTNFPAWFGPASLPDATNGEDEVTSVLNDSKYIQMQSIPAFEVPRGTTIDAGLMGRFNMGAPAGGECGVMSGTGSGPWAVTIISGGVDNVTVNENMSVVIPAYVSRALSDIQVQTPLPHQISSSKLDSDAGRDKLVMGWFKAPATGSVTISFSPFKDKTKQLDFTYAVGGSVDYPAASLDSSLSTVGAIFPHDFPIQFTWTDGLGSTKSITLTDPNRFYPPEAGRTHGIDAFYIGAGDWPP